MYQKNYKIARNVDMRDEQRDVLFLLKTYENVLVKKKIHSV